MIKECILCGKSFDTTAHNRIYCYKCSELSDRQKQYARENLEKAQDRYDAYMWKPNIFECDCEICGKHLKKEYKYIWKLKYGYDNRRHYFCSRECMKIYEREGMDDKQRDNRTFRD